MTVFHRCLASCVAAVLPASLAGASVISTFDADLEGWTQTGDLQAFSHDATGGNPGGYLYLNDAASGALFYVLAPSKFLGDLSAANGETLSFDANLLSRQRNDLLAGFGMVRITGTAGSAEIDLGDVPALTTWTSYSALLDAATWGQSDSEWAALLADVTEIRVGLEAINGDEEMGFDNFQIVPEPASLALVMLGAPCLLRRRRG